MSKFLPTPSHISRRKMARLPWSTTILLHFCIFMVLQTTAFAQLIRDRSVSCNSNSMEVSFEFSQPFQGHVYASKYSTNEACKWKGNGSRRLVASIPLNTNPNTPPYCGVQLKEETGEFNALLIITPMPDLLVDGMVGLTVRCLYNIGDVTLSLPAGPNGSGIFIRYYDDSPQSQAGVVTGSGGSPFLQMAIRDGHGINGEIIQAATVGQRITLDIVMKDTTIYDFYVHDCYAHDGTNTPDASISIIDANGCAVRLSRAVDVPVMDMPSTGAGTAKHVYIHMYGFQFTTSQLVYFECQVRPCLQSCNRPQCNSNVRSKRGLGVGDREYWRVKRASEVQLPAENDINEDFNLTTVVRIESDKIVNVIPAAQDASVTRAGRNELCLHVSVAIGILCLFVFVCIVSLVIAIFICHRAHNESKQSATYYTPASTPSNSTPSPNAAHFRSNNNRHRVFINNDQHMASYPASSC